jgi:predicted phage terminase large subunit-like protein
MTRRIATLEAFVPLLSPRFMPPKHLRPLTEIFHRVARGEQVSAVVNVPPRHSKTETMLHGIAWLLAQNPALQICYASYGQRIAEKKSRRARELARRAHVPLASDSKSRQDWRTGVDEGGLWATSVDGPITGEGFDVIILDDLVKGRAEAESAANRDRTRGWLLSDVLTRLEPGGSIVLSNTRWHPEDPAAHAIGLGWESVNLQALDADDQPLWPERWPADALLRLRDTLGGPDGFEWLALYQGAPRGRGGRVFQDVHFFDELPDLTAHRRVSIGLDFAYTKKTSSDYSSAVVMLEAAGKYYVLDVIRVREEPREFRSRLQSLVKLFPTARVTAYISGTEKPAIEFLRDGNIHVQDKPARVDKFSRAIAVAAAWNTGKVLLPKNAPWLNAFVSEVSGFTGVADKHDDQVDAFAAAFDAIALTERSGQRAIVINRGGGFHSDPGSRGIWEAGVNILHKTREERELAKRRTEELRAFAERCYNGGGR